MSTPYAPPEAPVSDAARAPGSGVMAVAVGLLVNAAGALLATPILMVIYAQVAAVDRRNRAELHSLLENIPLMSWVGIAGLVVGALVSMLAGYLCARIARHSEYRLGAIVAAGAAATGYVLAPRYALLLHAALAASSATAVMIGVYLGARRNRPD